jgi:KaiC/GvpD/RAD55 family RecA-like ATPase
MEIKEVFEAGFDRLIEVDEPEFLEAIKEMVKMDFGSVIENVIKAVEDAVEKAKLDYKPEDLKIKVEYLVELDKDSYFVTVNVRLLVKDMLASLRTDVVFPENICINAENSYISQLNKAERNEVGLKVKSMVNQYEKFARAIAKKMMLVRGVDDLQEELRKMEEGQEA